MCKKVVLILLYIGFAGGVFGKDFSIQQKVWLFKIVTETNTLNQNWSLFFEYKDDIPRKKVRIVRPGAKVTELKIQWDVIEEKILSDTSLLYINWEGIATTSPGLIAEAAVKLSLWELYSNLKYGFQENPSFSENTQATYFYTQMVKTLPSFMRHGIEVRKKYIPRFYDVLNPSLPLVQKSASLAQIRKLEIPGQKKILDKWHQLVENYVTQNSLAYFNQLSRSENFYTANLLAVGEGSGSSGLLNEFEKAGDGFLDTGTGKGIGLFTYEMVKNIDRLLPKFTSQYKIKNPVSEPTLLHLSLWGMDSNKKPLIVIEHKEKSYLLFGHYDTKQISPNDNESEGISYMDRLIEYEQDKISNPIARLHKENGLIAIVQREEQIRESIQNQVKDFELELDSLKKIDDVSEEAIANRNTKLNTLLSNLSKKERRISELQRKISEVYKKIDKAKVRLSDMKSVLGKHVQSYEKEDSIFVFSDGTIFNSYTQDLIINGKKGDEIKVKLLAASFSLESQRKDEVQLYVNVTGSAGFYSKKEPSEVSDSLLIAQTMHYAPDVYLCTDNSLQRIVEVVNELLLKDTISLNRLELSFTANGVDTTKYTAEISDVNPKKYTEEFPSNFIEFSQARRVDIELYQKDNDYHLIINGYTDIVPSRLSKNSDEERVVLNRFMHEKQSHNPMLSAFRVFYVLEEIEKKCGLDFSDAFIKLKPLQKTISYEELKVIMNQ
jgi:hypothetical protein